jgi:hypothetical protein
MFRNRFFILLGASFLAASAALADDVGFIDCSSHSEGAQVFGKPRRTPEVLAALPCGERFTILVYGFVFSRIQTSDGKIGYVYSNLIAVDRSGASVQQTSSPRMVSASDKVVVKAAPAPVTAPAPSPQPKAQERAPVQSVSAQLATPAQAAPAQMPETSSSTMAPSASAFNVPVTTVAAAQPTPAPSAPPAPPEQPAAAQPQPAVTQPATAQPAPAPVSEVTMPATPSNVPETSAAPAQPDPPAAAQPEPAAAQPAAPAIRASETRSTWEKRNPGAIRHTPLIEAFGGYAFVRQDNGAGTSTNLNGGMGSVAWNFKPWLQVVADSSYNVVTISGTKNVLYGNHFGPRYFYRRRNRWGATPFVEALVGGSRADVTFSGTGGYTTSVNCLSYKVGGGLDLQPSRHWEIRIFDVDYYRTAFGTNMHQNNYWASAGIVLRLFGGSSDY